MAGQEDRVRREVTASAPNWRWVAAGVLVVVTATVWTARPGEKPSAGRPPASADQGAVPRIVGATRPAVTRQPARGATRRANQTPELSATAGREVLAAAQTFLAGYLRYEVDAVDGGVRAALRRSATPALMRRLLEQPVSIPHGYRLGLATLLSIELVPARPGTGVEVTARTDRAGWVATVLLGCEHRGRRWLVSSVA